MLVRFRPYTAKVMAWFNPDNGRQPDTASKVNDPPVILKASSAALTQPPQAAEGSSKRRKSVAAEVSGSVSEGKRRKSMPTPETDTTGSSTSSNAQIVEGNMVPPSTFHGPASVFRSVSKGMSHTVGGPTSSPANATVRAKQYPLQHSQAPAYPMNVEGASKRKRSLGSNLNDTFPVSKKQKSMPTPETGRQAPRKRVICPMRRETKEACVLGPSSFIRGPTSNPAHAEGQAKQDPPRQIESTAATIEWPMFTDAQLAQFQGFAINCVQTNYVPLAQPSAKVRANALFEQNKTAHLSPSTAADLLKICGLSDDDIATVVEAAGGRPWPSGEEVLFAVCFSID
ncbi:hypothetical protein LTR37_011637 [Vermiconidia calcicola]|uniref:Uncharacterized protein n=1 Tax=Vermiconidia calcicola TaxID=1690605 RepID=A0ACC3N248_9PEZI|nr:hypothetical protein LTR37_011637 [Vermiconidia calcicola]